MMERDEFDLGLDILDRQLLDSAGQPCGKVDDLLIDTGSPSGPVVTHILTSPGALGPRLRGFFGKLIVVAWRRLHPSEDPQPIAIEWAKVAKIDSAVHLNVLRDEEGLTRSEQWAGDLVIGRIPGAA